MIVFVNFLYIIVFYFVLYLYLSQNYCLKFILLYISAVNKSFEDRKGYHIKRESFIVNENTAEEKKKTNKKPKVIQNRIYVSKTHPTINVGELESAINRVRINALFISAAI